MFKRIILMILVAMSLIISGCNKINTVQVTPTPEVIEETITLENLGE